MGHWSDEMIGMTSRYESRKIIGNREGNSIREGPMSAGLDTINLQGN